jgi:predicted phosphodiesterase
MKKQILSLLFLFNFLFISGQQASFNFAVISDMHISQEKKQNSEDLNRVVADINNQQGIAFVLVTGDITDKGDLQSLSEAKKTLNKLAVPFYVVAGNHDTKNGDFGINFKKTFGYDYFRHSLNGFYFLGLTSGQSLPQSEGHFAAQDILKLKRALKNIGGKKPIFFITHHPLKTGDVDNWYEITDVLRQYNTQAVIAGHYHKNMLLNFDGITGIITPTTQQEENSAANYTIYEMKDSLYIFNKQAEKDAEKLYALAVEQKFYSNPDTKKFPRPSFDVNKNYKNVREIWLKRLETDIYAPPMIDGEYMFFGGANGEFFCFDIKKGKQKWSFRALDKITGQAVASDGKIIFGSTDNNVYCLDAASGKLIWKHQRKTPIFSDAKIYDNLVFFKNKENNFFAINTSDGTLYKENCEIKQTDKIEPTLNDYLNELTKTESENYIVEQNYVVFLSQNGTITFADYKGKISAKYKVGNSPFNLPAKITDRDCVFTTASGYVGRIVF